ncbi:unnamed protein product [Leptidea sinapis]|uniref:Uncharacterized protein n=1 Tax=Leptidea sinapis TaxID=189913 RepID=A0A5E4R350_9NEOP|nr:unnamed protein product [Leptidea sinapis]
MSKFLVRFLNTRVATNQKKKKCITGSVGYPLTPGRGPTPNEGRRSPRPAPPPRVTPINSLTTEVVQISHLTSETSRIKISSYEVHQVSKEESLS